MDKKTCDCSVTRISWTRADGLSAIAPVSYRCAEHSKALRARDNAVDAIANKITRGVLDRIALPAPRVLLT